MLCLVGVFCPWECSFGNLSMGIISSGNHFHGVLSMGLYIWGFVHGVCSLGCSVGVMSMRNLTCHNHEDYVPQFYHLWNVAQNTDCMARSLPSRVAQNTDCMARSLPSRVAQNTDCMARSLPSPRSCSASQREEPSLEADCRKRKTKLRYWNPTHLNS